MRKLLLIVLIFLIIGAVSAHDDSNGTADTLLKDTEYNYYIDDDDEMLVVEQNSYIHNEVHADEAWSLNVYIDSHDSVINDEFANVTYDQVDIPTSVIIDDDEVPLDLGKHNIVYEFKFINTTSIYKPSAQISDGFSFDFKYTRSVKTPQNLIYRFNSQFNLVKSADPTSKAFDLEDINITYSDSLFFNIKGISSGNVNIYLDDEYFKSYEIDESQYEEEIDTTRLAIGSYNLVCIVESDEVYAEYNVTADTSNSMVNVKFTRSKITRTPNRYTVIINTTLNVCKIPELNIIYIDAPPVEITYTRSVPICFEGDGAGNLMAYIDGVKVYDNPIQLSWGNTLYIPTKDGDGNYFDEGTHDISFEFVFSDKYALFNPTVFWHDNTMTFNFLDAQESGAYLNDKYVINTTLKITKENTQIVPIDSQAVVRIVHTDDIKLKIDGLTYFHNFTVFVDDVEIYDEYTNEDAISIKTFLARSSIEETNERDITTGTHSIRFEFTALYSYDVDVEFRDKTLYFKFNQNDSSSPHGVCYQLNTSLIVSEKEKTVHIMKVKNSTYFDDTEFVVKMDLYKPEEDDDDEDDDDDDDEYAIGTQDVGIIVSDANGVAYIGDDLINVFESLLWNYDFENERLARAGTYTIKIINLADNTYDTASFEVKKENRMFSKKYSSEDFSVLFTLDFSSCREDLNDPCHITLDNKEKVINVKKALSKSKKEVLFKDIDPGTYTATFTLEGNEIYNDVTLKSKVTVKKQTPTISYHKSGGNKLELTIDIDQSKTDAVLTVSAGGQQKQFTVDRNTKHLTVEFDDLEPGKYDIEIDFKGNERYTSKTLTFPFEITEDESGENKADPEPVVTEPTKEDNQKSNGYGNNTCGIGTGSGNSNVAGSGNGTFNGRLSINGKGFNGDLGSQGSGNGEAKSYELNKTVIKKIDDNTNTALIFLIIALILLILSFIYERRDDDKSEEY